MIQFKACPRCQGDLELERNEIHEVEVYCVQCGYRTFGLVSAPHISTKQNAVRTSHRSMPKVTRPRVPGDRRSRRGGVPRRVLAGV